MVRRRFERRDDLTNDLYGNSEFNRNNSNNRKQEVDVRGDNGDDAPVLKNEADASTSDQDVQIPDSKLLQSPIQESSACNSSFKQSENLQKGKGVMTPDADLSDRFAHQYLTAQSSTYSEQSADTRGYVSLPQNQPSRTARLMQPQQQQQQAFSSNAAYGNEFNVHPSSRDRKPESFPFNPYLGGYTSSNYLNQISPSQYDGALNFIRPTQQSSTHWVQSADARGYGSLPQNQPSRTARQIQQQQASSSNAAYGNEFNVHPSSRDISLYPASLPFYQSLGGYASSNNLNQISPSQHDSALHLLRPMQQSSTHWEQSADTRGYGSLPQTQPSRTARHMPQQQQQQHASSSNVAYGNEFNVHQSSRDRSQLPFTLGGHASPNNLNQISPSQYDSASNFIRPIQQFDGSLAPESSTLYSGRPNQAYQGAQPSAPRSTFMEQQNLAEEDKYYYLEMFPEGTVFSGWPIEPQLGARRRPHRYLGQPTPSRQGTPPRRSESQEQQRVDPNDVREFAQELLRAHKRYHGEHSSQDNPGPGGNLDLDPFGINVQLDPPKPYVPDDLGPIVCQCHGDQCNKEPRCST